MKVVTANFLFILMNGEVWSLQKKHADRINKHLVRSVVFNLYRMLFKLQMSKTQTKARAKTTGNPKHTNNLSLSTSGKQVALILFEAFNGWFIFTSLPLTEVKLSKDKVLDQSKPEGPFKDLDIFIFSKNVFRLKNYELQRSFKWQLIWKTQINTKYSCENYQHNTSKCKCKSKQA